MHIRLSFVMYACMCGVRHVTNTPLCALWCAVQVLGLTNVSKWEQAPQLRKCIQQDAAIAGMCLRKACQDTVITHMPPMSAVAALANWTWHSTMHIFPCRLLLLSAT